jgi:hypothetical protein
MVSNPQYTVYACGIAKDSELKLEMMLVPGNAQKNLSYQMAEQPLPSITFPALGFISRVNRAIHFIYYVLECGKVLIPLHYLEI